MTFALQLRPELITTSPKKKTLFFLTVFYSDHLINNMTKNRFRLQHLNQPYIPSHNIPTFFFWFSPVIAVHCMICSLPTYLQTHLSGPDRRIFSLTEEREWYNEIPCCPMGSLPCSYSLSQSFSLQRAATKHGVYPDQVNPRSGACTIQYMRVLPLAPPPLRPLRENTHNATNPGRRSGSWFVMFRHSTCLPVLPACTACSADHGRIWVLFSFVYMHIIGLTPRAVLLPTFCFIYSSYKDGFFYI